MASGKRHHHGLITIESELFNPSQQEAPEEGALDQGFFSCAP